MKTQTDNSNIVVHGEKWHNDLNDGNVMCDGIVVANCYSSFLSPATIKSNAKFIAEAANNYSKLQTLIDSHKELLGIAKTVAFWFDNEANYPEGTLGYKLCQEAKSAIEKANKLIQ